MKVSDVDIKIIHKLLLSVPQGMEIESIDLTDGYTLRLQAGTNVINTLEFENSLDELKRTLKNYDKTYRKLGG